MTENKDPLRLLEECLVRTLLPPDALRQYKQGNIAKEYLLPYAKCIKELSSNYLSPINPETSRSLSPQEAAAYAMYYTIINFWKLRLLLLDLPAIYKKKQLEVLDFGCGPGTGILSAQSVLNPKCSYIGIDYSFSMIEVAKKIQVHSPWSTERVEFLNGSAVPERKFNIIFAANVISELGAGKSFELIEVLHESLARQGILILLEPGSKEITRNLMLLRDVLLSKFPDLLPQFPCTHTDPCPMLAKSDRDWCHGTIRWQIPPLVRQLDKLTEFNKHRTKFSAFVFVKDGAMRQGYRILADSRKINPGNSFPICGKDAFGELIVSKRNNANTRHIARNLQQYDLIKIHGAPLEGLILAPEASLEREVFGESRLTEQELKHTKCS
ncbi:MAG: methyltransferase domain-containing protein [SAR324 cluster bacterium]|uniref:Methyltransferase domain-containing protein n=1 Tax=SAR324 cluster bacterium TaxID=2024889 RepID=A0A7X9FVB4_9DELT|nr:methyltransferase domain-containing protein [SAR324 cluster bacterium]